MPSEKLKRMYWWALLLLSGLALLSYVALGWHTRMVADDYAIVVTSRTQGMAQAVLETYRQWSGSYSAFALVFTLSPCQPVVSAWVMPACVLALMMASFGLLSELVYWRLGQPGAALPRLALSTWLSLFIYNLSHQEALYWLMASIAYMLPVPLLLLLATLILRLLRTPPAQRSSLWLGVGLLMLINAGFGELIALSQVTLALLGLLATLMMPSSWRSHQPTLMGVLLLALLGALIFFVAPGNWVRLGGGFRFDFDSPLLWLDTARANIFHRHSLSAFGLMFLAFWGGFSLLPISPALSALSTGRAIRIGAVAVVSAGLWLASVVVPPMLAYGHVPLRMQPPAMLALVALTAALALLWHAWLAPRWCWPAVPAYGAVALLGLLTASFLINNLQRLPDFVAYSTAWDAYDAAIRQQVSEDARELEVPPMPVRLGISDNEWLHEQRSWLNNDMARYYGLDDIRLNPEIDAVTRVR